MLVCQGCKNVNYSDAKSWLCMCGTFNGIQNIAGTAQGVVVASPPARSKQDTRPVQNANLWRPLHEFAKLTKTVEEQQRFVSKWETSLPTSCGCSGEWKALNYEFNYGPEFLRSTVEAHDVISRQLFAAGKLAYVTTVEQAMKVWSGPSVGFFAMSFMHIGGTETWAECLMPDLRHKINVAGFACFDKSLERGNPQKLKVPYYYNPEELIQKCDIIVSWGTPSVVKYGKPVVSVNHTDLNSGWDDAILFFGDAQVTVNPTCKGTYIPNVISARRSATTRQPIKKTVLWGARFSEEKNPLKLFEIAAVMPDYSFTMVGDGWMYDECKAKAPPNVILTGSKENLVSDFETAECFISLSRFEGFGLSVGEAMLSRVPVISTETGICSSDVSTIVAYDAPPEDWADAIRRGEDKTEAAYRFATTFGVERAVDSWSVLLFDLWGGAK